VNVDGTLTLSFSDRGGKWTMWIDLDVDQPVGAITKEIDDDPTCPFLGSLPLTWPGHSQRLP